MSWNVFPVKWTRDLPPQKKTGRSARANHATGSLRVPCTKEPFSVVLGGSMQGGHGMLENPPALLLMLQKSHSQPPGMVLKPVVNNGINYLPTGAGFLNHQKYEVHFFRTSKILSKGKLFFPLKPATFIKCSLRSSGLFFSPSSLPSTTWLRATNVQVVLSTFQLEQSFWYQRTLT